MSESGGRNDKQRASSIHLLPGLQDSYKSRSLSRLALSRFLSHRMAVLGSLLLAAVVAFVILGSFFADGAAGNKPDILNRYSPPASAQPFGTDQVGRSILIRAIYGGQISLAIGILAVAISISLGSLVGLVSGYIGAWVDSLLSRVMVALLSIPPLFLLLVLSSALARNSSNITILGREMSSTVVSVVVLIGLTSWMQLSRIVRAQVYSLKEREFVLAARAIGAGHRHILLRSILPNLIEPIIVTATLGVGAAILTEAYLSFLGFGIQPPTATWGNMITEFEGQVDRIWWIWVFPGAFIVATVLAINFIGDGLRDALEPRSIK